MKPYGYDSYHGRSGARGVLKGIILLLVVVLLLALGAFFFLQRYMIFSADGVRFELPFLTGRQDTQLSTPPPATPPPVRPTREPEPTPTPEPTPQPLQAIALEREALADGTAAEKVRAAGGNAAVFDMKADDGTLGYVSGLKLPKDLKVSASDPELNEAIRALNGGELYTVARVSCFRDNTLPYYRNGMALRGGGGNWRDRGRNRWASPADEKVGEYLAGVCVELAQLGFDEIVLDYAFYPVDGKLSTITVGDDYTPGSLDLAIGEFYRRIAQALEPYEVTLSIVATPRALLEGADADSGQSLAMLTGYAGRIWVEPEEGRGEACIAALEQAGLAQARTNCVLIGSAPGSGSWAVLSGEETGA